MNNDKSFFSGLIGGVVLALALLFVLKSMGVLGGGHVNDLIAKVGSKSFTRTEAKTLIAEDFVTIENDEYALLSQIAEEWIDNTVLEREAKNRNVNVGTLLKKETWEKIKIDPDVSKNDLAKARQKRNAEYHVKREAFLTSLRNKYKAKVLLKKPNDYVPAIAVVSKNSAGWKNVEGALQKSSRVGSSPSIGPKTAPITMIEYADFHCGFCKRAQATTKKILENYEGKIHYVFKHYPLSNSPGEGSFLTHEASTCAQEQGKFWEFHDLVFETPSNPSRVDLSNYAREIGLDVAKFEGCLEGGSYQNVINDDHFSGEKLGVDGTPAFFLNGRKVAGAYPYEYFEKIIEGILDPSKKVPDEPKPPTQAPAARIQFNDLEGRPSKGAQDAPVTIVEFSDFHCPFCARVNPTLKQVMKEYEGKVRIVWRHFPLPFHQGAEITHQASECAREQDESKFWAFHDHLFENVGKYRGAETLKPAAESVGLDVDRFMSCLESEKYKSVVEGDLQKGRSVGVSGTPAFFVEGEKLSGARPFASFKAAIERALDPSKPLPPAPKAPAAAPPAPKNVEFDDLEGSPSTGPADAPITIVEFSDFHCPFCKKGSDTMKQVEERFSGKIRRVWRHFPLAFHVGAEVTHQASECAGEQGKFWEYKDKIFDDFSTNRNNEQLIGYAKELGLKESKFKKCLESGKYKEKVASDIKKGQEIGVRGTPGFFVNGKSFAGAYPFDVFEKEIESQLKKSE